MILVEIIVVLVAIFAILFVVAFYADALSINIHPFAKPAKPQVKGKRPKAKKRSK